MPDFFRLYPRRSGRPAAVAALCTLLCSLLLPTAGARAQAPLGAEQLDALRNALQMPGGLEIESARQSAVPGLIEVQFEGGPLVYATPDGSFFLLGDLFTVSVDGYVNLSERRRDEQRREQMAAVDPQDMIIFPAEGERRGVLNVFTDVTCPYCQKLHEEVPELNRQGVEVRYLAYPRAGVGSAGFRQLATAWCAPDRQATLTRLNRRESVEDNVCPGNPVAEQYDLGQLVGVRGTPAIITGDGQMIPGYRPADALLTTLGLE
jgi:thiol:disulfide interchange protein DsbC